MKKSINVLGTKYKIKLTNESELAEILNSNDIKVFGLCDYSKKMIYLDETLPKVVLEETLRHELVHAFFHESGLGTQCDYAREEELIDWIALQLPKMTKVCKELEIL